MFYFDSVKSGSKSFSWKWQSQKMKIFKKDQFDFLWSKITLSSTKTSKSPGEPKYL